MKKLLITLLSVSALFFTACDVEDKVNEALGPLLTFDIDIEESFTVRQSDLQTSAKAVAAEFTPQTVNTTVGPIKTNIDELLSDNKASKDNIEAITTKSLKLKTLTDFNAFQSLKLKLGDAVIGAIDPIPADMKEIDLGSLTDANLKDQLIKDEISLGVELVVKELLQEDLTVDILGVFEVKGRLNF